MGYSLRVGVAELGLFYTYYRPLSIPYNRKLSLQFRKVSHSKYRANCRKSLPVKYLRRSRPARLAVSPLQARLYVNSPPYDPQTVCRLSGTIHSSSGIPVRANTG